MPLSSVGRASLSESEGPRFEAASGYQLRIELWREARAVMGRSAKPERRVQLPFAHPIGSSGSNGQAPDFYSGLCGFESCLEHQTPGELTGGVSGAAC